MKFVNILLEYVFPLRKSAALVRDIDSLLPFYELQISKNYLALSRYKNSVIRAAVHEAKFKENPKAFNLLSELLENYLKTLDAEVVILPIPLSKKRYRERGYNQVERVLKLATQNTDLTYRKDIMIRTRHTTPQTKLDKKDRLQNITNAFAINDHCVSEIENKHVLILDDVATTGATLKAARAALVQHHPASIVCLALAH